MHWEIQKHPKIKKYKEYLKKLILSIAETMNDFLPDLFSFFTDQGKQQVNTQLYCCVMLQILEIKSANNWSKSLWSKN